MKSDIIYSPVITEKTSALAQNNVFVFKVAKNANKIQIKQAIEGIFNVKVESITTSNSHPKKRRVGKYTGQRKTYKKAIITLCDGYSIEL